MTDKQKVVLKGLLDLTPEERREVIMEAQNYQTKTFSERSFLDESLNRAKRIMGPTSGNNCPCCGR